MAIGAGNLWRFPRLAGQYGGSFLLLWILFLLVWSIPLLLAEFSIGKKYKKGVIGSFAMFAGKPFTFMGFFITACALGIAFYYSVVTAWALRYFSFSISNIFDEQSLKSRLIENPDYLHQFWNLVSNGNWITILLYIAIIVLGSLLLANGLQKGLERANKILIPSLFVLLIIVAIISLKMEKGFMGLEYMFTVNFDHFSNPIIWIEALTQSAWSTGAGWGLIMTISSYSSDKTDVTLNTFVGAFGNNLASLMAGIAILPAVFAMSQTEAAALIYLQGGNQALTFTVIPILFSNIKSGALLSSVFFMALFFAALSSLLAMIELLIKNLSDLGFSRVKSTKNVIFFFIIFGFPSAYSLDFFTNQDWVWGIGLIVSGLFILYAVAKYGFSKFKKNFIDSDSDFKVSFIYFKTCMTLNIPLAIFLIYWWMSRGYSDYPWFDAFGQWNIIDVYSNASIITQWIGVLVIGLLANNFLYRRFTK